MSARGDKEREIAATERARALEERILLKTTLSEQRRAIRELAVASYEEAARHHEALADAYDREDEERREEGPRRE